MITLKNLGFGPEDLQAYNEELLALNWETRRTARHEYFMSHKPRTYSYGGTYGETYISKPFSPLVGFLLAKLNLDIPAAFNVCFLNKYDDEKNHLGWHADDFEGMRPEQPIGVVSFGATREIWIKPKSYKGEIPNHYRFKLEPASLFLMPPYFQDSHLHRIPKHDRPCGWRISLTFRSFRDES